MFAGIETNIAGPDLTNVTKTTGNLQCGSQQLYDFILHMLVKHPGVYLGEKLVLAGTVDVCVCMCVCVGEFVCLRGGVLILYIGVRVRVFVSICEKKF